MLGVLFLLSTVGPACAQEVKALYPSIASIEQYRSASHPRSCLGAQRRSGSDFRRRGSSDFRESPAYETAVKGKNGFVCVVERAWASLFSDSGFGIQRFELPCASILPLHARSFLLT